MANTKSYILKASDSVEAICKTNKISTKELISANNGSRESKTMLETTYRKYFTNGVVADDSVISVSKPIPAKDRRGRSFTVTYSVSGILSKAIKDKSILGIVAGISIKIPISSSGGKTSEKTSEKTYNIVYQPYSTESTGVWKKKFNCFVTVYLAGCRKSTMYLPVYPNEFSDSNSAQFNPTNIFGRSVAYQTYEGSSRSISFTLSLHEELCPENYNYIHKLVSLIESSCYPGYNAGGVQVPEIEFVIGNHFKCRGVIDSTNASWRAPIIDGKLVNCDLGVSIKETRGPYSMSEVAKMEGYR